MLVPLKNVNRGAVHGNTRGSSDSSSCGGGQRQQPQRLRRRRRQRSHGGGPGVSATVPGAKRVRLRPRVSGAKDHTVSGGERPISEAARALQLVAWSSLHVRCGAVVGVDAA